MFTGILSSQFDSKPSVFVYFVARLRMDDMPPRYMEGIGVEYEFAFSALESVGWDVQAAFDLVIDDRSCSHSWGP